MTRRPRIGIAVCAGVVLAAFHAASALAGSEADTIVKVKSGPPPFHGKVKSDETDYCVADRKVKLKKERRNGGNKTLGKTRTDASGNWTIVIDPLKSGVYFAKAPKVIDVVPGISCIGAKSENQVVD